MELVKAQSPKYKVDSKSITKNAMNLIIEVRSEKSSELVNAVSDVEGVAAATLMHHEGEVKN